MHVLFRLVHMCATVARNIQEAETPQTENMKTKWLTKEAVASNKSYSPPYPTNCIMYAVGGACSMRVTIAALAIGRCVETRVNFPHHRFHAIRANS
jgi:hypothetical protein